MSKFLVIFAAMLVLSCSNESDSKSVKTDTSRSINQSTGGQAVPGDTALLRPDSTSRR